MSEKIWVVASGLTLLSVFVIIFAISDIYRRLGVVATPDYGGLWPLKDYEPGDRVAEELNQAVSGNGFICVADPELLSENTVVTLKYAASHWGLGLAVALGEGDPVPDWWRFGADGQGLLLQLPLDIWSSFEPSGGVVTLLVTDTQIQAAVRGELDIVRARQVFEGAILLNRELKMADCGVENQTGVLT